MKNMKKFIYTFYLLCNLACICSCVNEEADLFASSAAQRLNQAVTEYTDLLENSENGWIMDYYPSDGSLGGYTLTVVFKNGKSAIASEISYANDSGESWPAGTEVTSLYQVKAEQEVILTFDSYNPLLHYWSEPTDSDNPTGFEGDYEFSFKEVGQDIILLKGKKHGNRMMLTRLREPASTYIKKVLDMSDRLSASPRLRLEVNGNTHACLLNAKQFTYYPEQDNVTQRTNRPYLFTDKGIRLYEPVSIDGSTFQEFILEEDMQLKAVDSNVSFPRPNQMEVFCAGTMKWSFSFDFDDEKAEMSDNLWTLLQEINEKDRDEMGEDITSMFIGKNPSYPAGDTYPICIGWTSSWFMDDYDISYGIDMRPIDGTDNQVSIILQGPGYDFELYNFMQPLATFIGEHSPYKVEFDDIDNPTSAIMSSISDSNTWFKIAR